jgi:hypothetical protein
MGHMPQPPSLKWTYASCIFGLLQFASRPCLAAGAPPAELDHRCVVVIDDRSKSDLRPRNLDPVPSIRSSDGGTVTEDEHFLQAVRCAAWGGFCDERDERECSGLR